MEGIEATVEAPVAGAVEGGLAGGEDLGSSQPQSDLDILNEPDAVEKPADDGVVAKPEDGAAKVEEPKKEEPTTEDPAKKAAEEKKPDGAEVEPVRVAQMREAIEADPAIKAALEANPKLRNMVYANARRAETLTKFQEHIKTPELARMAKEAAEDLGTYESEYLGGKPEGFDSVLDKMYRAQCKRDDQGNFLKDADGNLVSSGKYEAFLQNYRTQHFWPGLQEYVSNDRGKQVLEAAELEGDDVLHAVGVLKKFLGDPDGGTPVKTAATQPNNEKYANYSADDRKKLEEYDRLKLQEANKGQEAGKQYSKDVTTEISTSVKGFLGKRVEKLAPALSEAVRKRIIDDAYSEIDQIAKADKLYRSAANTFFKDRSADGRKKVTAHAMEYAQEIAGPIVQRLVKEFAQPAIQSSTERAAKIEKQAEKTEPKSAGGVNEPSRQDDDAAIREADKLSRKLNGRGLNDREILDVDEILPKLRKQAQARA